MAVILYRRLPRVVFQEAAISTSKWRWSKHLALFGNGYLFKSAKAPPFSKDNQNKLDNQKSSVAYHITTYTGQITDEQNGTEENEVYSFDNDYPIHVPEPPTKTFATRSQFFLKDKQIGVNLNHREPARTRFRKTLKTQKNSFFDDIESYNTKQDPRAFQQHRPEYKLMCYRLKCSMQTSTEEGEGILQKVTNSLTPSEVKECLEKLSYLPEEKLMAIKLDGRFNMLCRCSTSNLRLYTNSEIISILGTFVRLGIARRHSMLKEYEQEFCLRALHLSTNEFLLVADTFRYMGFNAQKFLDIMYSCLQVRCLNFSMPQVIQLTYIVGEGRHAPQELLEKIEAMVFRYLTSINLEEIGTICLGFFKTGNGISEHLMERFGDIVAENVEQVTNYALVSVLKMFRFTRVVHMQFFSRVGQEASKRISEMRSMSIMHVVLAFASMHILDKDLMDAVALAIPDRVSYCRSKDLAKFLWSFGVLKYEPPNADVFYSAFINHIRDNLREFETYPEHFLTCLMGLAFCQQFPLDLINIALSEKLIMQSTKISTLELKKDLFTIAGTVEIECPQYTGNTISPELRKEITNMLAELSTRDIHRKEEAIEAAALLQCVLGGPQYVKEHMILPHTRLKDLEVHLDVNKKPVAINSVEKFNQPLITSRNKITDNLISQLTNTSKLTPTNLNSSGIKNPENPNTIGDLSRMTCLEEKMKNTAGQSKVIKLAIQVTNRNQYLYGSKQLLGLHVLKRRQLYKLGYVVVEVPHWEWFPLVKRTRSEKLAYLHHKVFNSV